MLALVFLTRQAAAQPTFRLSELPRLTSRVVSVKSDKAISEFIVNQKVVERMVEEAIQRYFDKPSADIWPSLISTEDTVGIKVASATSGNAGTRVETAAAVVKSMIAAGISPKRIIVWDRRASDLRAAGFGALEKEFGIRVSGAQDSGYSEQAFYDTPLIGKLVWGDKEFGLEGEDLGKKSYVSKLVSDEMTKILSIAPALNHNMGGTAGHLMGLGLDSVDNTGRFRTEPRRLASAVPELYAMEQISDRVVLCLTDALLCQFEGEQRGLLHYSAPLGEIRISTDPVALDVLAIEDILRLRAATGKKGPEPNRLLYSNASLLQLGTSNPRSVLVEQFSVTSS